MTGVVVIMIIITVWVAALTKMALPAIEKNEAGLEECIKSVAEIENEQIVSIRQQENILGLAGDLEKREDAISDMAASVITLQLETTKKTEELQGKVEMLRKNAEFDRKIQEELVRRVVRLEMAVKVIRNMRQGRR